MAHRDVNPYAPPASGTARQHAPADRRSLVLRGVATIALSCSVGASIASACAYALLQFGLRPWSVRRLPSSPQQTIDLLAGGPMVVNNLLLSVVCGMLAWPACWRHQVSTASAVLVVVAVSGVAMFGAVALQMIDLYAIGGTEAVLLYQAIAAATIGLLLAIGFARSARRTNQ